MQLTIRKWDRTRLARVVVVLVEKSLGGTEVEEGYLGQDRAADVPGSGHYVLWRPA